MTKDEARRVKAWLKENERTDRDARFTEDHTFDDYPGDDVATWVDRVLRPAPDWE